jgi:hypothetical protein
MDTLTAALARQALLLARTEGLIKSFQLPPDSERVTVVLADDRTIEQDLSHVVAFAVGLIEGSRLKRI